MNNENPLDLSNHWMPFTANRQFKAKPRLLVASNGMHYTTDDGRQVLDGVAGLWCVNAGHGRKRIAEAIKAQADEMDYAPAFQMGHPGTFKLATRLADTGSIEAGVLAGMTALVAARRARPAFHPEGRCVVDQPAPGVVRVHRAHGGHEATCTINFRDAATTVDGGPLAPYEVRWT